jgi:hypothetical protein
VPTWAWVAFIAFVLAMLAVDLFVLHRHAHEVSLKEAGICCHMWPGRAGGQVLVTGATGGVLGGGQRVLAELGQDVMGLAEDLAGLGQRGALAVAAVLDLGVVAVVGG